MKVLLLNGSPHEKGCTYTALSEVAAALESDGVTAEILWVGASPTMGCMGCGGCRKIGYCVRDDVVNHARRDGLPAYSLKSSVSSRLNSGSFL